MMDGSCSRADGSVPACDAPRLAQTEPATPMATRPVLRRLHAPSAEGRWPWRMLASAARDRRNKNEPRTPIHAAARPRRMKQTAPMILVWAVVWYVVALTALAMVKDRWRPISSLNECWKWPRLLQLTTQEPERPLVLMLGSSRTCWAWKAGTLDSMQTPDGRKPIFYNFGIPATGPISESLYLRQMLDEGIRPHLLLVEYLPPLMRAPQRGFSSEEVFLAGQWMTPLQLVRAAPYLIRPVRKGRQWLEARLAPWYAFRAQIDYDFQCLAGSKDPIFIPQVDESGWCLRPPMPSAEERAMRLKSTRDGYAAAMANFPLGAGPAKALRDLCKLCRREHIPFVFVVMPECSDFRSWYSAETRAKTDGFLQELSRGYGAEIINANEWVADDDFEDGHHLTVHGAEVFTNRLRQDIQRLLAER